jgi:hypothetical protein
MCGFLIDTAAAVRTMASTRGTAVASTQTGWFMRFNTTHNPSAMVCDGDTFKAKFYVDTAAYGDSAFHSFGFAYNPALASAAQFVLYTDGTAVTSPTKTTDDDMTGTTVNPAIDLNIGRPSGSNAQFFNGTLWPPVIFTRMLTASEMAAMHRWFARRRVAA